MQLAKVLDASGRVRLAVVADGQAALCADGGPSLCDVLASSSPTALARELAAGATEKAPLEKLRLLAPLDQQEVWAAGVTYKRGQQARMEESEQAASFYDRVYSADRPELFLKATPHRVVGPGEAIRIRKDTRWTVPEPELTLAISPDLRIVGYTVGNDVSARDIEGENPLYLPQAKIYDQCAGLGPVVTLADAMPPFPGVGIRLVIRRSGEIVFQGETTLSAMNRSLESLVDWLGKDNSFPAGAFLMTGTGIVPPDDFSLEAGDESSISIDGIGTLVNPVVRG
jgi:2-dehydro-3-deoxy-D-arabinonate dehydratase